MTFPLTQKLAEFAVALKYEDLPKEALNAVRLGITDCAISMIAAKDEEPVPILIETLGADLSDKGAGVLFGDRKTSAAVAALINGTAAHALDMDDVALRGSHPSAVLLPAILAEAEQMNASGKDIMTAYAAGFEVWARIVDREQDLYLSKGWHLTCVIGAPAAAAALANLKGLTPQQAIHAIAIAATMSSGTVAGWKGHTKAFQVGRAAQNAVTATRLAEAGMLSSEEGLEAPKGLLAALSPRGNVDLTGEITDLGSSWRLASSGVHVKLYPFALGMHRAMDGMLDLVTTHDLNPDDIAKVTIFLGPGQADYGYKGHIANARPFAWIWLALASMAVRRQGTLKELDPAFYDQPQVARFRDILTIETRDDIPDDPEPNMGYSREVCLLLKDGRSLRSDYRTYYPGHWTRSPDTATLHEKFMLYAGEGATELGLLGLFDKLQRLEDVEDVHALYEKD